MCRHAPQGGSQKRAAPPNATNVAECGLNSSRRRLTELVGSVMRGGGITFAFSVWRAQRVMRDRSHLGQEKFMSRTIAALVIVEISLGVGHRLYGGVIINTVRWQPSTNSNRGQWPKRGRYASIQRSIVQIRARRHAHAGCIAGDGAAPSGQPSTRASVLDQAREALTSQSVPAGAFDNRARTVLVRQPVRAQQNIWWMEGNPSRGR